MASPMSSRHSHNHTSSNKQDHGDQNRNKMESRSSSHAKSQILKPSLKPKDAFSFFILLSDLLRLQAETIAMAMAYIHQYRRHLHDSVSEAAEGSNEPIATAATTVIPEFLDHHTLALTALSLSTKSTESPRRLRALLVPAYNILNPTSPPLSFPSHLYDTLRHTIVTAELHLLRILKFELRLVLPHEYISRYITRALAVVDHGEDFSHVSETKADEDKIVAVEETRIGREVVVLCTEAMKSYRLCFLFPPRAVALGCAYSILKRRGVEIVGESVKEWVDSVAGGSVHVLDFEDVLDDLGGLEKEGGDLFG